MIRKQLFLSPRFVPRARMIEVNERSENVETKTKRGDESPLIDSLFIVKQMILPIFATHIACDSFNLTSFSVISDPSGFETIDANLDAGGGTLDRVVVNNWPPVYVRMCVEGGKLKAFAIMTNNDVLQTKYVADMGMEGLVISSSLSIGDLVHIVIENVTKHMGTSFDDANMNKEKTKIVIGFDSDSRYGTWTSIIEPDNVTVELDCEVVGTYGKIVTAKCNSETTWPDSVFNRIPIYTTMFGSDYTTNQALFGIDGFSKKGSVPSGWDEYNVTGSGSSLTIGDNQLTIMGLPESFVSYWVDTIHAKAWMGTNAYGNSRAMLVPPDL